MKLKPQQSTSKQKKEEEIFLIPTNKIKGKRWQSFSLVFHLHIFVFICASVDISIIPLELYLNFHKQQKVSKIFSVFQSQSRSLGWKEAGESFTNLKIKFIFRHG